jgi:hypothetical protein
MANDYAVKMRAGAKLPPEGKVAVPGRGAQLAPYVPDDNARDMVRILAANGVAGATMAKLLQINHRTLLKYFKNEIKDGFDMVTARIGVALVSEAMAGNVAAQRYWLGTHGGERWRTPKDADQSAVFDAQRSSHPIKFYMPSNHRDEPEELGPIIDATVEDAA